MATLLSTLQAYNTAESKKKNKSISYEDDESASLEHVHSILDQFHNEKPSNFQVLPTFYTPKAKKNTLLDMLKKEARSKAVRERRESLLCSDDIEQIWQSLRDPDLDGEEPDLESKPRSRINYDNFCQVATRCRQMFGPHIQPYFKASVFLKFEQDGDGCISIEHFIHYLHMRTVMQKQRIQLSDFSDDASGTMTKAQLEEYIGSLIPETPVLAEIQPSLRRTYQRICVRKILFFHAKNGIVHARDFLMSGLFVELTDLKNLAPGDSQQMTNWFSLQSTMRVYNTFMALDVDSNGLLKRSEFSAISNGTMSSLFINRIFEEHVAREGLSMGLYGESSRDEMDLAAFTDFVLAWDHRAHPAVIKYFFPIFDLGKKGYITPADLYTFFKEIHAMWCAMGETADLSIYDVIDEIIDMIKPKNSPNITAQDLAASGMSGTFFNMLSDVKQFWEYNYRENLMHQDDE